MNATGERTWWQRNLKWVIAGGVLLCLLTFALFIGGVVMLASSAMRSNDVHRTAMERVAAHPEAVARLGTPVEPGFFTSGSIEVNPRSGSADVSIPVSGPQGSGAISVVARKRAGTWYYDVMQLESEGSPPIELRTPDQVEAARSNQ
jgi:hypothetical protein